MYFYTMDKPDKLMITHESLGGYDGYLSAHLIIIESVGDKILRVYSIERPTWHTYYDKAYPYCPPNLN